MVVVGSGSPTSASRTTDFAPSAPISAAPAMRSPLAVVTTTPRSATSKPVTRLLVRRSINCGSARQPSTSEPWVSGRCVTAYGLAKRLAKRLSSGMSMTFSPLTPSIISRCSMNTASFFTSAPTPSASSACQALGAIWMPAPISPNCGACSSTMLLKPLRASASAAASPPMPPPAITTGFLFLEEDRDAIDFTFRIDEVHALVGDRECIAVLPEAMLYQGAVDALFLVAEFDHREGRAHPQLRSGLQHGDIADLVHGPRQRKAGMRARMAVLLDAQLEERAVVVHDGGVLVRILLPGFERQQIRRVGREEREPVFVAVRVQEARLVIQELLRRHCAVM